MGLSTDGARALMRPVDNKAYEFQNLIINGYAATDKISSTVPYITGQSFAAGTVIIVELILNVELIPLNSASLMPISMAASDELPSTRTLSDEFPSPESAFKAVKSYLTSAVALDYVEQASSLIHPTLGFAIGSVRSMFGKSSGKSRAAIKTHQLMLKGRQSTVTVEEMLERADPYDHPPRLADFPHSTGGTSSERLPVGTPSLRRF